LNCEFARLPDEALLHISGPDTLTFLQGQTTCDTRALDDASALPGAYCTPQGRVVCDFLLLPLATDHVALRMRRDIAERAAATFGKYIVFSKATLETGRRDWEVSCCFGEDSGKVLGALCGALPSARFGAASSPGLLVVQVDEAGQQFECYVDRSVHPELPQELSSLERHGGAERWRALQVASGIGRIEAATVEAFVPQMLNYDVTGHISFKKGCYTGQEVVARLHYRGKSKRRLYLVRFEDGTAAEPGADLYTSGGSQSVGQLVNRASDGDDGLALVVATHDAVAEGLFLGAPDGPALQVGELPYSVDSD
jgi:folate-binding protein YgfZ